MKFNAIITAAFVAGASTSPVQLEERQGQGSFGNGPYGAVSPSTDSALGQHTFYVPNSSRTGSLKLPVLVWGNGGCGGDGASNSKFLGQAASFGYLAIASGNPGGGGSTTSALMKQSIDYITRVAGTGRYANVDASLIMAAGFSCGGVEAMDMSWDSRVKTIGVFSSGLLTNYTAASAYTKPILYVMGGSGDIAYNNAERDFRSLAPNTPAWKGNLNLGHGGDLFANSNDGGKFGKAGIYWMEWLFRGSQKAGNYFTANGFQQDGWQVQTHALNLLKPFVNTTSA